MSNRPELCPRYAARLITGIKIGPSPLWLRNRLTAIGLRPINNVVDITNFVMMEYGQPLHAFDFDNLMAAGSMVRSPRAGRNDLHHPRRHRAPAQPPRCC